MVRPGTGGLNELCHQGRAWSWAPPVPQCPHGLECGDVCGMCGTNASLAGKAVSLGQFRVPFGAQC